MFSDHTYGKCTCKLSYFSYYKRLLIFRLNSGFKYYTARQDDCSCSEKTGVACIEQVTVLHK